MEEKNWKLTVTWNEATAGFEIKVEPDNVFVGLSLAALADRVLRRIEARAEAATLMQNAPRIVPGVMPGTKGPLG